MQTLMNQVMHLFWTVLLADLPARGNPSKHLKFFLIRLLMDYFVLNLVLDWVKWSTWDTLWARLWSKIIQKIGDLSTNFMYHIFRLRRHSRCRLVLHWTHTDLTSSTEFHCKDIRSLYKVSYSRIICIWLPSKHAEVSSDTICCMAPGFILRATFGH